MRIDILDYFTGDRSFFEFYDFLWELPKWGKFNAKLALDEDFAEHLFELRKKAEEEREEALLLAEESDEPVEEWHRPEVRSQEHYTPELAALYGLDERIQGLTRLFLAANFKGKPPDIRKSPRPYSALDILELEDERDEMHKLAETFGLRKDAS